LPISDSYVVQYLVQGTCRARPPIIWREQDHSGYVARVGNLEIALENAYVRSGSFLVLRFRYADHEFEIREPAAQGWFGRHYVTEDQRNLATLLRGLMQAAAWQCHHRHMRALENPEQVREEVYRHLLFEQPADESGGRFEPVATTAEFS
jgi:hypothetical protein